MKHILLLVLFVGSTFAFAAPTASNQTQWHDSAAIFIAINYINKNCPERFTPDQAKLSESFKSSETQIRSEFNKGAPGLLSKLEKEMAPHLVSLCKKES